MTYRLEYIVKGSGFFVNETAGQGLGDRKVVYRNALGTWSLADADAVATMPVIGITMEAIPLGQKGRILLKGYIGLSTWTWTIGGIIYASTVAGELTQTAPSGVGDVIQVVAMAGETADMIYFDSALGTGATGCAVLEGSTAYVGFDDCKEPYANYFLCDGAADDVQINLAEAYVTALGGGTVELERGTFTLADPIIPTGNDVWYKGQGEDTFLDGDGLATLEHVFHVTGRTDVQISDMSMQTQDGGGKVCYCVFIEDGSHRFQVRNIWVVDSDSCGIRVEGTTISEGWIEDCRIMDADAVGISVDMDAANFMYALHITGCDISPSGGTGIFGETCGGNFYWVIEENVVHDCLNYGIQLRDGDHSTISNNVVYDCGWNGIYVIESAHVIINDNHSYHNLQHGMYIHDTDDSLIEGNQCIENDSGDAGLYDGIYLDGNSDDNLILGNKCNDNDRYGINVAGARSRVKENDLSGNTAGQFNDGGTDTRTPWIWASVPNPDSSIGQHQGAQMPDLVTTAVGLEFYVPLEFQELVTVQAVVLQIDDAASGNMVWTVATDYGKICTESYIAHQDTAGATTAITQFELECLDVADAFTVGPLTAGDLVGFEFTRIGGDGSDSLDEPCYLIGVRLRYV